ncbi:CGNR zinc finger domain-containing protein [Nocardioides perillae]|uniref:Putative RNA-binding Zn ribbon-like protein n=1 Tax=Nocardioides perillae TaxID=1119534 RepID=A0A7Y9RQV3_9ACTN|nr:CGNR zinc finger domain-containing protein [Nocardioides perillae]NYG54877.1 putative RNA-binding Zn ribbon-like protein [Nocardioides perillae]
MDFVRYAEASAGLLNADLGSLDALRAHLAGRPRLQARATERDARDLRRLQTDLRPVFAASGEGRVDEVVTGLNALLARHPVAPVISAHDGTDLHLHVAHRDAGVAEQLTGEALLGLATLVCDLGATRLGVCGAERCEEVYVDTSPNSSRRYCSERCSSRANVAAYRARRRAAARAAS